MHGMGHTVVEVLILCLVKSGIGKYKEGCFMKAEVVDGCISCGACVATCPEVFRFDEDGVAEAYAKVTPEHESAAVEAKEECPVAVIIIEE